ncbi:uncharacterized protein METZ01_LOCUS379504 [marine metagenome]|uniref:Uncharacterized protein n=1 Tax=marine metagenome TaxID=408172 RepID=A0A382TX49_9ZZZZ
MWTKFDGKDIFSFSLQQHNLLG